MNVLFDPIAELFDEREGLLLGISKGEQYRALTDQAHGLLSVETQALDEAGAALRKTLGIDDEEEGRVALRQAQVVFDEAQAVYREAEQRPAHLVARAKAEAVWSDYVSIEASKRRIVRIDLALPVMLAADGRKDEAWALFSGKFGAPGLGYDNVVHASRVSVDDPVLGLLGPDKQVWLTKAANGDRFLSLKPALTGEDWILVEVQTRYVEAYIRVGPKEDLLRMMSVVSMSLRGIGFDNGFASPVLVPVGGDRGQHYTVKTIANRFPRYLRLFGLVADGWIRFQPLVVALAADPPIYSDDWYDDLQLPELEKAAEARQDSWVQHIEVAMKDLDLPALD